LPESDPLDKAIDLAMQVLYDAKGNFDPTNLDKGLLNEIRNVLKGGLLQGYGLGEHDYTTPDKVLIEKLTQNLNIFSGFKTYQELKAMNDLLINEDGKLKTFAEFKKDALAIHKTYNTDYLLAEYNLAVASGQMGAKWVQIEKDRDILPNLTYKTAGDSNVRPSHRAWANITLPIDHPFWNTHYPPNGWNCRCEVIQTDAPIDDKNKDLNDLPLPDNPMFENNVGKTGIVFPRKHPYYQVSQQVGTKILASINDNLGPGSTGFRVAETIKEAEQFAISNKLGKSVSYRKLKVEVANAINEALLKNITGGFGAFDEIETFAARGKYTTRTCMQAAMYRKGDEIIKIVLQINYKYFEQYASLDLVNENIKRIAETGWWVPKDVKGLVHHEFGHLLTMPKTADLPEYMKKRMGLKDISVYGASELDESLAEIFTKYSQEGKDNLSENEINLFNKYSSKEL
jgi:hypothetical protein